MRFVFLVVWGLVLACGPGTRTDPSPTHPIATERDGIGTLFGDACVNLRRLGCVEGFPSTAQGQTCFERLTNRAVIVEVPGACLKAAETPQDVRACGNADTLTVRCLDQ